VAPQWECPSWDNGIITAFARISPAAGINPPWDPFSWMGDTNLFGFPSKQGITQEIEIANCTSRIFDLSIKTFWCLLVLLLICKAILGFYIG